ncbi:MAG: DUF547 domain-containing protein, partial [Minwuiales bacterium]|nr:DUF547 domain-containing protein [Minwuiales bacterium]
HDPSATQQIDHRAWDQFLRTYVRPNGSGLNLVAYSEVTAEDRRTLEAYLSALAVTPISRFNRAEQVAYWINLYNALTVKVILDHYPVESIRKISISPGLFSIGPWDRKLIRIEGEDLTLNDIEHRILRPIWQDPRIHYAVNCASISCPNLMPTAFTGANADELMTAGAREYINSPRGVTVRNGRLYVSSIYDWFDDDFGGTDARVIAHLREYALPALDAKLARISRISGDDYDWDLNGVRAVEAAKARRVYDRGFGGGGS